MLTIDAKCHNEIKMIGMDKDSLMKTKNLLRGRLNTNLKKKMVKTTIWSMVLYDCETWTTRKASIRRLEAFERWVWRRMAKVI